MQPALWLEINPKVWLLGLVPRDQLLERYCRVRHEHVRDGTLVEDRHPEHVRAIHLVYEALVPNRIKGTWFCGGAVYKFLVDVYRDVRIDELIAEPAECHRVARLKVRRSQPDRFAHFQAQGTRKHFAAIGWPRRVSTVRELLPLVWLLLS